MIRRLTSFFRGLGLIILLGAMIPADASARQTTPKISAEEDNDGLPGARRSPNRGDIEALIRAINRDPVSDELVDRIDALFRPRWTRPSSFWGAKGRALDPAIVGILDEVAQELTKKPADTRMILSRVSVFHNSPGRAEIRGGCRDELAREAALRRTIKGRILDEETGKPIANVAISAYGVMTRTDAKGNYVFKARDPSSEEFCLSFEAPGYALTQSYVTWQDLSETEAKTSDHRLPRAQPFTGHVLDPQGKPVEGVNLEIQLAINSTCRDGSATKMGRNFVTILDAKTDATGAYSFHGIPPDLPEHHAVSVFTVKHPKYVKREKIYAANELLGPGWEITLEPGCVVKGVVTDAKGKPVKNASVTAFYGQNLTEDPSTSTDADGKYQLEGLDEASVRMVINPSEQARKIVPVDLKKDAPTDLNVSVEDGFYFVGKVIGMDGKPAINVQVGWIEPVDENGKLFDRELHFYRFTHTKEDGTFKVGPVPKGRYQVSALKGPPRTIAEVIAETDGKALTLELRPDP